MYRTGGFICFRKLFVPGVPAGYTRVDVQSRRKTIEEDRGFLAVVLFGCNTLALSLDITAPSLFSPALANWREREGWEPTRTTGK
jgi:hypothetical protein